MDFVVGAAASKSTLWSLLSSSRDLLNQREFGCFLFVATPTKNLRIIPIVTIPSCHHSIAEKSIAKVTTPVFGDKKDVQLHGRERSNIGKSG